jgi:hypothetical protein
MLIASYNAQDDEVPNRAVVVDTEDEAWHGLSLPRFEQRQHDVAGGAFGAFVACVLLRKVEAQGFTRFADYETESHKLIR